LKGVKELVGVKEFSVFRKITVQTAIILIPMLIFHIALKYSSFWGINDV